MPGFSKYINTTKAGSKNIKLYMYSKSNNLNILTNNICDFFIGSENNKSLSFASNNIPCDLYIPSIKARIVRKKIFM